MRRLSQPHTKREAWNVWDGGTPKKSIADAPVVTTPHETRMRECGGRRHPKKRASEMRYNPDKSLPLRL